MGRAVGVFTRKTERIRQRHRPHTTHDKILRARRCTHRTERNFWKYLGISDVHFSVNVRRREVTDFRADNFQISKRESFFSLWPILMTLHLKMTTQKLTVSHPHFLMGSCQLSSTVLQNSTIIVGFPVIRSVFPRHYESERKTDTKIRNEPEVNETHG